MGGGKASGGENIFQKRRQMFCYLFRRSEGIKPESRRKESNQLLNYLSVPGIILSIKQNLIKTGNHASIYRFWFDPYWVHADPYRTKIKKGETVENKIVVRNFSKSARTYRIDFHIPAGIAANPAYLDMIVSGESRETFLCKFTASANAVAGRYIIAFDITMKGKRFGEWFDAIIEIVK